MCFPDSVVGFNAKPNETSELFMHYVFTYIRNAIQRTATGSSQDNINIEFLTDLVFKIPPKRTQDNICEILANIEKKIELNNQINCELEAMAKMIYDYWFVQFDFPDENGKPYKTSGGKMIYNEELKREIPEGWRVKELREIEPNIVTGKTPSKSNPENFGGEVPFICIGDVRENIHITKTKQTLSKLGADSQLEKYVPKGAICVTCIASPGLVGFTTEDSQTNQQLNTVVCDDFNNRYFLYFYLEDYFRFTKAKSGNTFANMNKDDFSSIKVIQAREETLEHFSNILNSSFNKILINSKENNMLEDLRDWLLPMLMNGQITVKDL
jgi:type I restriction enzyme S subunit